MIVTLESIAAKAISRPPNEGGRRGFTLVELMVAMALTLFIMVILTEAFVTSLATFSTLKSIGDLQANLRTVSSILQTDLASDHFEGRRKLSNPDLLTSPPSQGFFYIYQGSAAAAAPGPYVNEGIENVAAPPPGLQSWLANNHVLYFTVKLRRNRPESFMSAVVPSNSPLLAQAAPNLVDPATQLPLDSMYLLAGPQYYNQQQPVNGGTKFFNSQWAEVCYFLVQTGSTTEPGNPAAISGTPLFALYRAQYLSVMNPTNLNSIPGYPVPWPTGTPTDYANVSSYSSPSPASGSGATVTFTVSGTAISAVTALVNGGSGYPASATFNLLVTGGGGTGGVVQVTTNSAGVVTGFTTTPVMGGSNYIATTGAPTSAFLAFNGPDDVASTPINRTLNNGTAKLAMSLFGYPLRGSDPPLAQGKPPSGSTLVLSNVTSFQVQVFSSQDFTDLPLPPAPNNTYPVSYDTASNPGYSIQAIKVTIRIWDAASQLSRQVTIIQDM